jgi:hypothetical protein
MGKPKNYKRVKCEYCGGDPIEKYVKYLGWSITCSICGERTLPPLEGQVLCDVKGIRKEWCARQYSHKLTFYTKWRSKRNRAIRQEYERKFAVGQ